ncbi:MAG: prepilin peptidase [Lachnospiraceae bacterium]|nr:prepilin peptidase [Lachnospiraceae bacterium]
MCLVILSVAAVCDVYSGRIPREVTCFGMLISQLWIISHRSVDEALIAIAGSFGIMILLYPLFMIGTLGAGDIKLIMILPAYMPFADSLITVFMSFAAGACIGLVKMITAGTLHERLRVMKAYIEAVSAGGRLIIYDKPASMAGGTIRDHQIHFSIPVLIGTAVYFGGFWKS